MNIKCPNCNTKYKIDVSLISESGTKMECAKCSTVFEAKKRHKERVNKIIDNITGHISKWDEGDASPKKPLILAEAVKEKKVILADSVVTAPLNIPIENTSPPIEPPKEEVSAKTTETPQFDTSRDAQHDILKEIPSQSAPIAETIEPSQPAVDQKDTSISNLIITKEEEHAIKSFDSEIKNIMGDITEETETKNTQDTEAANTTLENNTPADGIAAANNPADDNKTPPLPKEEPIVNKDLDGIESIIDENTAQTEDTTAAAKKDANNEFIDDLIKAKTIQFDDASLKMIVEDNGESNNKAEVFAANKKKELNDINLPSDFFDDKDEPINKDSPIPPEDHPIQNKKGGKRSLIIAALVLIILSTVSGILIKIYWKNHRQQKDITASVPHPGEEKKEKDPESVTHKTPADTEHSKTSQPSEAHTPMVTLGVILPVPYNMKETKVMSMRVIFNLDSREAVSEIESKPLYYEDILENTINDILKGRFYEHMKDFQTVFKDQIITKINNTIHKGKISSVNLEEVIVN